MLRPPQPAPAPDRPNPKEQLAATLDDRPLLVFWISWIFATALGLGAYNAADWALSGTIERAVRSTFGNNLSVLVDFLVIGAALGALQGLVLRLALRWPVSRAVLWVLANAFGFTVGVPAGMVTFQTAGTLGLGVGIGVVIGILEGLVLRWQVSKASLWVLANAVGFAGGSVAGFDAGFAAAGRFGSHVGFVAGFTVGGAVAGAVTGTALALLLARSWAEPAMARGASAAVLLVILIAAPRCGMEGPMVSTLARPVSGRIAFSSNCNGSFQLYITSPDGSSIARLSNARGESVSPVFSPDGRRIAFASDRDGTAQIYIMDADGSHVTRLTGPPGTSAYPAFSPDGTRIAFMSDPGGSMKIYGPKWAFLPLLREAIQIYMMNVDGSNVTRLTNLPGANLFPTFSPDGTKIAFVSQSVDTADIIHVMNVDGSNVIRLTTTPEGSFSPTFSPDGRKIAFTSLRDDQIYLVNADGTNVARLANLAEGANELAFSRDGTKIVFASSHGQIYVMNADGTRATRLTTLPGLSVNPVFSP